MRLELVVWTDHLARSATLPSLMRAAAPIDLSIEDFALAINARGTAAQAINGRVRGSITRALKRGFQGERRPDVPDRIILAIAVREVALERHVNIDEDRGGTASRSFRIQGSAEPSHGQ